MKELKTLPVISDTTCKDCGAKEWEASNQHPDGGIHECSNCTVWDEEKQMLVRKNIQ
jgi:hypothetical protein